MVQVIYAQDGFPQGLETSIATTLKRCQIEEMAYVKAHKLNCKNYIGVSCYEAGCDM